MILSVVIITCNEQANIARALASVTPLVVDGKGEIIVVDSGSTDRTVEIAKSCGAKVFVEKWKGYAAQKNSAIDKATGDWILSLDADEEVSTELCREIQDRADLYDTMRDELKPLTEPIPNYQKRISVSAVARGFFVPRKNFFLGRWIQYGGFWPDPKLRFFRRGSAQFQDRLVHEDVILAGPAGRFRHPLLHYSYPTLADYIEHMNRYSSLGAEMAVAKRRRGFSPFNIVLRPALTFIYNYFFRLGFLDGREGLLLHLYHAVYVSWKYAKAWELARGKAE
jgi:glycosyltransferase involved in cell wall biosynthesis